MQKMTSQEIAAFNQHVLNDPLARDIWNSKYRFYHLHGETDEWEVRDTHRRVIQAVYAKDPNEDAKRHCLEYVEAGLLIPAGRINAGAGTGRNVTELNCFVLPTVMDSMTGIQLTVAKAALTMQQGGGIGVDFSPIRPAGALVRRTGSVASGVIPFADQQDGMCSAIASAGARRGAMMLTLRDDHPDLWNPEQFDWTTDYAGKKRLKRPSFISAKQQPGRLTQFNMSVLVSHAFMDAVHKDDTWDLGFHVPRADGKHVDVVNKPFPYDYYDINNDFRVGELQTRAGSIQPWYVYERVPARVIWEDIMQATYKYSEPGVIFIDRINERNNLAYCEEIRATNPCGEQPLPPNGCCDLGSLNTAFMVLDPFTPTARLDFELMHYVARAGVRMLDNVLDIANFPLVEQKRESDLKRRIGLGITGWGDALVQLGIRYGSKESVDISRKAAMTLRNASYEESVELARERGPFPAFDAEAFHNSYNVRKLPNSIIDKIDAHGIRNGVLNTIAPNGTISLYVGNVSSAHEPIFSLDKTERKVRQPDGTLKTYESVDYAYRLYEAMHGATPRSKLPDYFVGAYDISPQEHMQVHCAWQEYIDASCSKTTNCPTDMPYENFKQVYDMAYHLGAKGCTTYRDDPESGRGSVLTEVKPASTINVAKRPAVLTGRTHKLKWPLTNENWYITINSEDGVPREMFIVTKNVEHQEWVTAMSRTVTAILRRGGDVSFLVNELVAVHSATGGAFIEQQYCPSVVAAIGRILRKEFVHLGLIPPEEETTGETAAIMQQVEQLLTGEVQTGSQPTAKMCPECHAPAFVKDAGCWRCLSCGYNTCG